MPLKSSESHQGRDKRSNWGESICCQNMRVLSSQGKFGWLLIGIDLEGKKLLTFLSNTLS